MAWIIDPVHSSVEFAVRHMVIATVKGRFTKYEVDASFDETRPELSSVEARIDTSSIDTRDAQRDAHLRSADFLHSEEHPFITFRSREVKRGGGDGEFQMLGDLTIRGVTRQVALDSTFAGLAKDPWGNQRAGFSGETTISRKDFGLEWNVALETGGWLVGDKVKISLDLELIKQG